MKLEKWLDSLKENAKPTVDEAIEYLGDIFPLLKEFKNTPQDPIWHAEGNVHIHTDMVLTELYDIFNTKQFEPTPDERQILVLSALLHDIAKPIVTKEVDGRIKASRHEVVGRDYLSHKLLELDLPHPSYKQIINLVGSHQRPKLLVIKNEEDYKYFALSRLFDYKLMYWLELADLRGRTCEDLNESIMYLDEWLVKTEAILTTYEEEKSLEHFETYKLRKFATYLLSTGQISSVLEARQKVYERLQPQNSFRFTLMCGVPGVGKSTLIDKYIYPKDTIIISMDDIRQELGDRRDQSKNKQVAIIAKERLKEALINKQNVLWDATSIRQEHREELLTLAENYGAYTVLNVLVDKESNIRKKNKEREYSVPDEVITKMLKGFQYPSINEAVSVNYVNVGTIR